MMWNGAYDSHEQIQGIAEVKERIMNLKFKICNVSETITSFKG